MERRIFHGNIKPHDVAHALMAEFNRGNMHAQVLGNKDRMAVQIATRRGTPSGGHTALTINLQSVEDGILVEVGQQAWLGVAASLGHTALSALRSPFNLLGRLDDLAQDIESIQLNEKTWKVIERTIATFKASYALSEKLARLTCEYCGSANPVGEAGCLSCGGPLGDAHPTTCLRCGFVVTLQETRCPNCSATLK
jgi:hypothetical protein